MLYYGVDTSDSIAHYGILGMRWGVRRFQNKDGTLTAAGRRHYDKASNKLSKIYKKAKKAEGKAIPKYEKASSLRKRYKKADDKYEKTANKNGEISIKTMDRRTKRDKFEEKYKDAKDSALKSMNQLKTLSQKGDKWYSQMEKTFSKTSLEFDPEVRQQGEYFLRSMMGVTTKIYDLKEG